MKQNTGRTALFPFAFCAVRLYELVSDTIAAGRLHHQLIVTLEVPVSGRRVRGATTSVLVCVCVRANETPLPLLLLLLLLILLLLQSPAILSLPRHSCRLPGDGVA